MVSPARKYYCSRFGAWLHWVDSVAVFLGLTGIRSTKVSNTSCWEMNECLVAEFICKKMVHFQFHVESYC